MKNILRLMRSKHWLKNILIFFPAFFSKNLWEKRMIVKLFFGFLCFCFITSIVYIFNDINDIEKDRMHKVKCLRPLAAGIVSKKEAKATMVFLGMGAILCNFMITCDTDYVHMIWCFIYIILNFVYSIWMKNIPILDVFILAAGFMIRIFYGASLSGVYASSWLCLTVMSFALYMGIGKRKNELNSEGGNNTRKVLKYYNVELLDRYMIMAATLGIVFYSMWAEIVVESQWMIWTVPLVLMIIMKYEMIIRGGGRSLRRSSRSFAV